MGKEHYIEHLKEQLHEIMERPVTLGRAEEITVYADAICALQKLDDDHFRESTKMMEFTREDAEKWVMHMENEDGTTGARWTMEQTDAVANITGVSVKSCVWWAATTGCARPCWRSARPRGGSSRTITIPSAVTGATAAGCVASMRLAPPCCARPGASSTGGSGCACPSGPGAGPCPPCRPRM